MRLFPYPVFLMFWTLVSATQLICIFLAGAENPNQTFFKSGIGIRIRQRIKIKFISDFFLIFFMIWIENGLQSRSCFLWEVLLNIWSRRDFWRRNKYNEDDKHLKVVYSNWQKLSIYININLTYLVIESKWYIFWLYFFYMYERSVSAPGHIIWS